MKEALIVWAISLCVLGVYVALGKLFSEPFLDFLERRGLTDSQVMTVFVVLIGALGLLGAGAIANYKMCGNVWTCEYKTEEAIND